MSKKYKKRKQKQKFSWLLLALGGVLIALAVFLFARQGGDGGGAPSIAVNQQKIDFGDIKFNTNKTFVVKITNTGGGTLRFKEEPYIEVLEGC